MINVVGRGGGRTGRLWLHRPCNKIQRRARTYADIDETITRNLGYFPVKTRDLYARVAEEYREGLNLRTFYRMISVFTARGVVERVVVEDETPGVHPTYGYRLPRQPRQLDVSPTL